MAGYEPPTEFVAELRRRFSDFVDLRWNEVVSRWEFVFLSAVNRPVSQFWGWFYNPLTRERLEPDPMTGLMPFRGLEPEAQAEILKNLDESFLGNRQDGAGTWEKHFDNVVEFNKQVKATSLKRRGETYAQLIKEVDLRRPWLKHHRRERRRHLPS